MAKANKITAVLGTSQALKDAVAMAESPVLTLGSVVAGALEAHPDKVLAIVDTENRKVVVAPKVSDVTTPLTTTQNTMGNASITLTPDDATKRSSPFTSTTGGAVATALNAEFAAVKPSFTAAQVISKIEDVLAAQNLGGIVVVDQVLGTIKVTYAVKSAIASQNVAGVIPDANTLAEFLQVVPVGTAAPRDPFE